MEKEVFVYKSKIFQEQVNSLTFKENGFAYKQCRTLVEMIKAETNIGHLKKIEKLNFNLPLYIMKTQKECRVILTLEDNNKLTFLRLVTLDDVQTTIESLHLDDISPYDFKEFW